MRDTLFERKQHESTAKHQNNLKRFLRDVQNDHERGEREKQKAKAEVDRLNRLTGAGTAQPPPESLAPTFHRDKTAPRTADDQRRQWQQLADMGIQVPDHVRADMAMVGDWKATPKQRVEEPAEESLSVGIRKRKLDDDDDEEDQEVLKVLSKKKVWGRSLKALPGDSEDNLDALFSTSVHLKKEMQDPGGIAPKRESPDTTSAADPAEAPDEGGSTAQNMSDNQQPALSEGAQPTARSPTDSNDAGLAKNEAIDDDNKEQLIYNIPEADPAPVFKRRKAKATGK